MLRSGSDYINQVRKSKGQVWYQGERKHPLAIEKINYQACVIADYYQHQKEQSVNHIFSQGESYSTTLFIPKNQSDLERKAESYYSLARNYLGVLGRAPDYINVVLSTWVANKELFGEFSENVEKYYNKMKQNDLFVTHTTAELKGGDRAGIRVVKETPEGVYLTGARAMATSAALCDEIFIAPTRTTDNEEDKAIVCTIPVQAEGLHLVCRENFVGHSLLSQYYDESDSLLTLENVFVPWERVFIYKDVELYNSIVAKTGTSEACSLQTNARAIAKSESLLAVMKVWVDMKPVSANVQAILSQVLRDLNILKSLQQEAIAKSHLIGQCFQPNPEVIETAKIFFMESYPKTISELRNALGAELLYLFRDKEMVKEVVDQLSQQWGISTDSILSRQKSLLYLFDILLSGFGTRQELYEKHYAGTYQRVMNGYWKKYSKNIESDWFFTKVESSETLFDKYFVSTPDFVKFETEKSGKDFFL